MNRRLMFDGVPICIIPCSLLASGNGSAVILYGVMQKMSRDAKCYPSYDELKARSGLSRQTVCDGIKWLNEQGWIEIQRRFNSSSIYTIRSSPETRLTHSPETRLTQSRNRDANVLEDITNLNEMACDARAVWSRVSDKLFLIPWSGVPIINSNNVSRGTISNLKRYFSVWLYGESKAFSDFEDYMAGMKAMYSTVNHPFVKSCAPTLRAFALQWEHYAPLVKAYMVWRETKGKLIEFPDVAQG